MRRVWYMCYIWTPLASLVLSRIPMSPSAALINLSRRLLCEISWGNETSDIVYIRQDWRLYLRWNFTPLAFSPEFDRHWSWSDWSARSDWGTETSNIVHIRRCQPASIISGGNIGAAFPETDPTWSLTKIGHSEKRLWKSINTWMVFDARCASSDIQCSTAGWNIGRDQLAKTRSQHW